MTNEEFIKSISLEGEIWKDVIGYEGLYMVSSFGRVISLERKVSIGKSFRIVPFSIKKPNIINDRVNYKRYEYHLYKGKRERKAITAHRIVATAFIPNPNNYPSIDHIDGNPFNNHISNLRWCTNSMNMNNPITKKRISLAKKGKLNNSKSIPVVQLKDNELIQIYPSAMEAKRKGYILSSVLEFTSCFIVQLSRYSVCSIAKPVTESVTTPQEEEQDNPDPITTSTTPSVLIFVSIHQGSYKIGV